MVSIMLNVFNAEDWPVMMDFLVEHIIKLELAMRTPLTKIKYVLNQTEEEA